MTQRKALASDQPRRPVSCDFCIRRKLRCSRDSPCTNCSSRGQKCSYLSSKTAASSKLNSQRRSSATTSPALVQSQNRILERQHYLENVGRGEQAKSNRALGSIPGSSVQDISISHDSMVYADVTDELASLERIGLTGRIANAQGNTFVFKQCPVKDISSRPRNPYRRIDFPPRHEMHSLLNKYISDITSVHPIVHEQSLRRLFSKIIYALDSASQEEIELGDTALALAVMASATYFWTDTDSEAQLPLSEARRLSPVFLQMTEDVLREVEVTGCKSLEGVQAFIIVFFLKGNVEGISLRCKILFSTAVTMARELGLQRIDKKQHAGDDSTIRDETSRRVWWYLAASDWMLARFPGQTEGSYSIHMKQMTVRRPLNINDSDLDDVDSLPLERPKTELTTMSYFLQRLRLTEILRDCSDRISATNLSSSDIGYSDVMYFDAELNKFRDEVPPFFDLTLKDSPTFSESEISRIPCAENQRYTLNCLFHAQLCRLHVRYFARAYTETRFAYSREVCLRESRLVVQAEIQFERNNSPFALSRLRFLGMLYGVHMANIIFLLDAYICKSSGRRHSWPAEATEALAILEKAKDHSSIAADLCGSMTRTMRKYDLWPPKKTIISTNSANTVLTPSSFDRDTSATVGQSIRQNTDNQMDTYPPTPQFFDFADDFEIGEWADLFNGIGLELPFI